MDGPDAIEECRFWLRANPAEEMTLRQWWRTMAEAGWAFPSWPVGLGGRGLSSSVESSIASLLADSRVVSPPTGYAVTMLAPTVLRHGTPAQQNRLVASIARGEICACQLFSEPEAGSDLASLRTRAVQDGDRWIVNGQKVWTSGAFEADVGMLLTRTDPAAARHAGISYFLLDMHQPEITVRPLRQMNGMTEFNEVFIDGAHISEADLLGSLGGGWEVAQTTLAHERSARPARGVVVPAGESGGWLDTEVGEILRCRPADAPTSMFSRSGRTSAKLAQDFGRSGESVLRDKITQNHILSEISRWTTRRLRTGLPGGAQISKLQASDLARRARDVDLEILGAAGMLAGPGSPHKGAVAVMAMSAHRVSIGGGTDEIQKNVLAERVLGLPKEP